jgi:hypothetical protein
MGGGRTVTCHGISVLKTHPSMEVKVTAVANVPSAMYVCAASPVDEEIEPSPNVQSAEVIWSEGTANPNKTERGKQPPEVSATTEASRTGAMWTSTHPVTSGVSHASLTVMQNVVETSAVTVPKDVVGLKPGFGDHA